MRIAVVSPYDLGRPGGVQDQTTRLVGWLGQAGHDATLIGPGVEGPEGAVLLGATTVIPANRSRAPIKLDPRIAATVRQALEGFDVVHVHEPFVPVVSIAALRAGAAATVATFHADPPRWVRSGYQLGRVGLRSALSPAAVVTAVSPVAGSAIEDLAEYRVVPNGIEVADYLSGPKLPNRVTFLGRDEPRKGLAVLLEAWPRIRAAVPDATLQVLGAERSERVEGVSYLGRVSEGDKRSKLAASAVHVAPNLGGESFGIVVLEAMASSCAVVASAIPAFEYVAGDTAAAVEPGDVDDLADSVIELLEDPPQAAQMGAAARRRANQFDGSVVASQYLDTYQEALG